MARALKLRLEENQYQPPRYRSDDTDACLQLPPLEESINITKIK